MSKVFHRPLVGFALLLLILGGVGWLATGAHAAVPAAAPVAPATALPADQPSRRDALRWQPAYPGELPPAPPTLPPAAPGGPLVCGVQGPWQPGPTNDPARWGSAGGVGPDGKFYVVGGMDGGFNPRTNGARYNPATNAWEALPALPFAVGQVQGAWVGNRFYVPGGYAGSGVTNILQIYDLTTNSWSAGPPLPGGLEADAVASLNGKIYVLGGDDGAGLPHPYASNYIFDPGTNAWTSGAALPAARTAAGAAAVDGLVYLFGGVDVNQNAVDSLWAYNPATNSWVGLTSANSGGYGNFAALTPDGPGKLLAVYGGQSNFQAGNATGIYDIAANTWSAGPALLTARLGAALGTLPSGTVVTYGGVSLRQSPRNTSELLAPVVPCETPTPAPPTATSTPCGGFSDVHPSDYFYAPVQYLVAHGVISGYNDCTFRPYADTTRSQMVKIVVLGFNIPMTTPGPGAYTFTDVPPTFPFYSVIETAAAHSIVSGYTCGGPNEPCDNQHRPYFRPYADVTRGQLSKITVGAANWPLQNPAAGSFADVAPGSAFYQFVETAACHGVISGYACGGRGEPCDGQHRPYFRQTNNAVRGQIAKIVYLSITGSSACGAPTATALPATTVPTVTATATAVDTATPTSSPTP